MFSTFDCAVKGYRQKEDAWNAIISGFMTGGCLAARSESLFLVPAVFKSDMDSSQMDGFLIGVFLNPLILIFYSHFSSQAVQKPLSGPLLLAESYLVYSRVLGFSLVGYSRKAHDHNSLLVSFSFSTLMGYNSHKYPQYPSRCLRNRHHLLFSSHRMLSSAPSVILSLRIVHWVHLDGL
jgi:hypothetical protein